MVAAHRSAQSAADLAALAGARGVAEGRDGCASAPRSPPPTVPASTHCLVNGPVVDRRGSRWRGRTGSGRPPISRPDRAPGRPVRHRELGQAPGSVCRRLLEGLAVRRSASAGGVRSAGPASLPTLATVPDGAIQCRPGSARAPQSSARVAPRRGRRASPAPKSAPRNVAVPLVLNIAARIATTPSGEEEQAEDHHARQATQVARRREARRAGRRPRPCRAGGSGCRTWATGRTTGSRRGTRTSDRLAGGGQPRRARHRSRGR